jgi:hypothetical protein
MQTNGFSLITKNPAYEVADTILFLAYINNQAVGKIMGIIHREYNELQHIKEARFFIWIVLKISK